MKLRKALLLVLCAILLVAGSVMGTLAYLADQDTATNTFTVGEVEIYLDETDIDGSETKYLYDALLNEGRDLFNKYEGENKLVPGCKIEKDPQVWIKDGSEESFVRVLITVDKLDELKTAIPEYVIDNVFLLEKLVEGWNSDIWEYVGVNGNVYEFRYHETVTGEPVGTNTNGYKGLEKVFTHVKLPGDLLDNAEMKTLDGLNVTVNAQAIQALGFEDSADAAWAAFDKQMNPSDSEQTAG